MPNPQPDDTFPPIETLLFAADVFFRFCHNQPYSLFHEATFRQRLVSGELRPHLVWALLAAARRYSSLPNLQLNDPDDAQFYAKKAWDCMKLPWSGGVSDEEVVPILQTIILIVNVEHPCKSAGALSTTMRKPPNGHEPVCRQIRTLAWRRKSTMAERRLRAAIGSDPAWKSHKRPSAKRDGLVHAAKQAL
ncbi:hypothetical protein NW759_010070 [Fusarium solani]|nr:hypothetical protein NW759_010070 [Fusarium solani]